MFKERSNANPIAYSLFRRGMNLPSGHNLSEDEIDYVCKSVREVLGKGPSAIKRRGPVAQFFFEKNRSAANVLTIPFTTFEGKAGSLRAITYATLNDPAAIEALAEWRKGSADAFPSQFKVSSEGTRHWLRHGVLDVKDRFLFWVIDEKGDRIGHIGLFRLSLDGQRIEIDNVVRGKSLATRGHMSAAVESLITWQRTTLGIPNTFLRVFSDNRPAIEFYDRLQFREILRVPLKKVVSADVVEWKEVVGDPYYVCQRYFITMEHGRNETNAARPR